MYISKEMHDVICDVWLFATLSMIAICALMIIIPLIWDKTKYARMHLREWIRYRIKRHRIHQAYKVSNEPTFKAPYWRRGGWR